MKEILQDTVLACDLTKEELIMLAEIACEQSFFKNELIFNENEAVDSIYLLLEGRVQIERKNNLSNPFFNRQLLVLKAGQVFGEMAFIEKGLRSASARAKSHVRAITFSSLRLEQLMLENPLLGYKIMTNFARILSQRLRRMNDQWLSKSRQNNKICEY